LHSRPNSLDEQVLLTRKCNFDYHFDPNPNSPPTLDGSTLGSFARMYVHMTDGQKPPTGAPWYSEFWHRFLIFDELLQHFEQPEKTHLDNAREVEKHFQLIYKCRAAAIRLIQPRAEPVLAAQIQQCLARWEPLGLSV
jgi:hypothetical protein